MTNHARVAALAIALAIAQSPHALAQTPGAPSAATVTSPDGTQMALYYMVFLRRGPAWTSKVTPETRKVSADHLANIQRLTREGRMVVAGPFDDQSGERALAGIFILRAASLDDAKAIADSDPAVKAGRFVYEIAPWWGPKSLRY